MRAPTHLVTLAKSHHSVLVEIDQLHDSTPCNCRGCCRVGSLFGNPTGLEHFNSPYAFTKSNTAIISAKQMTE